MRISADSTWNGQDDAGTAHQQMMAAIAAATATLTSPPFQPGDEIRKLQSLVRNDSSRLQPADREAGEKILAALEHVQQQLHEQSTDIRRLLAQNQRLEARAARLQAQNEGAERRSRRMFAWGILLGLPVGMLGSLLMWAIGIS